LFDLHKRLEADALNLGLEIVVLLFELRDVVVLASDLALSLDEIRLHLLHFLLVRFLQF
jgi:hypothetical protein